MQKLTILLDIEALLDTRYGRLVQANPRLEPEILFKFSEYCSRDHDNFWLLFPEISESEYMAQIVTKETLKKSKRTNVFNVIDDVIRSMYGEVKDEKVEITILFNTGGFELTAKEVETFLVLISSRYEHQFKVKHVDKSLKQMTPKWLAANVNLCILYRFNDWVDTQVDLLEKEVVSNVVFYIPTLFHDKQEAERNFYTLLTESGIDGDPTELISDYIWENYRINLHFISNRFFSPISIA